MTPDEILESTLAFHAGENPDTDADREFSDFCDAVAKLLGVPHLDGSDDEEGYSLDAAHDFLVAGLSTAEAAAEFRHMIATANGAEP